MQMKRAEKRQAKIEREYARSMKSTGFDKAERKAIAQAKKEGTGLVLSHRPKKTSQPAKKAAPKKK